VIRPSPGNSPPFVETRHTSRAWSGILEPRGYYTTLLIREPDDAVGFEEARIARKVGIGMSCLGEVMSI
jgi:hypothetical protein